MKKRLMFTLYLAACFVFTVSSFGICGTKAKWEGEWERINGSNHEGSSLTIKNEADNGFEFIIDAASGGNVGQIEGRSLFLGDYAVFSNKENDCIIIFSKNKDKCIVVTPSDKCSYYGGIGVVFDGTYCEKNKSMKKTSLDLIKLGIFKNENQLKTFKKLVGNDYSLFESSIQFISKEDDLDHLNANVSACGVTGLFTISECIIMSCQNGMIYAAVIDGDKVKYYSNDPKYSNKTPTTIDKWRLRFKEKPMYNFNQKPQ